MAVTSPLSPITLPLSLSDPALKTKHLIDSSDCLAGWLLISHSMWLTPEPLEQQEGCWLLSSSIAHNAGAEQLMCPRMSYLLQVSTVSHVFWPSLSSPPFPLATITPLLLHYCISLGLFLLYEWVYCCMNIMRLILFVVLVLASVAFPLQLFPEDHEPKISGHKIYANCVP